MLNRINAGPSSTDDARRATGSPGPISEPRSFADSRDGDADRRALIVIPALNEAEGIATVLEQVLDDEDLADPLVVVADGGSTDGTREVVREISRRNARVRLIDNPNRLQSAGVNRAVDAMAGDRPWLVRVDAHSEYPEHYASSLIDEAVRTGATSVVVSVNTIGQTHFQRAVAAAQNSRLGTGGSLHRNASSGQWVDHGHHGLCRLAAYRAVGGYDETFSHNEDAELDVRLGRQGARIWLTDRVRSNYYPRRTMKALAKQYFNYGRGRARTVLKHHTPLKMRQAAPLAVAPAVAGLALTPIFWAFALPAAAWSLAAIAGGAVLAVSRRDPVLLMSGPAAMTMHLGWSAGFWTELAARAHARMRRPHA